MSTHSARWAQHVSRSHESSHSMPRQKIESVHVRPAPDEVETEVEVNDTGQSLDCSFTPRTRFKNRLGPGWRSYFWFVPDGGEPVKPVDNLDGTYSASIAYSGSPPKVALHFIDGLIVLDDDVTPDQLPGGLEGSGITLIDDLEEKVQGGGKGEEEKEEEKEGDGLPPWAWILIILVVLILLWLFFRSSSGSSSAPSTP